MIILLDAGPLGLISNPKAMEIANECREWMREQTARGVRFCLPEIVDYEVRRELLRGNKVRGSPGSIFSRARSRTCRSRHRSWRKRRRSGLMSEGVGCQPRTPRLWIAT